MYFIQHIASGQWLLSPHDYRNLSNLVPVFNGGLTKPDEKLVLGLREFHLDGYSIQVLNSSAFTDTILPIRESLTLLDTCQKAVSGPVPLKTVFLLFSF